MQTVTVRSALIVGASVAGIGAANELRRCGFAGPVTLVDAQPHLPYDRPPLSKAALGSGAPSRFHEEEHYRAHGITLRLGVAAHRLDTVSRGVTLTSGERFGADAVLLATGGRARPFQPALAAGHVHTLRDLDDADRLRAEMAPGKRLAMVGGGFIGAEVASSAASLGLHVTIVEAAAMPFAGLLGTEFAARIADLHAAHGVQLLCGSTVERITDLPSGERRLQLSRGGTVGADIVVAGIGSLPNVEWLEGSGLDVENGVRCDAHGRTTAPGIYAAGDDAAWWNPVSGRHERHEHWTAAREQGRIAAQHIAGTAEAAWEDFVPYFWSDLHGKRLQLLGSTKGADATTLAFEDPAKGAFVVEYRRAGRLIGVAGCNAAARTMRYGHQVAQENRLATT